MIKSFSVKNYKSIKELIEVDFTNKGQMVLAENKNLFKEFESGKVSRLNFIYGKNSSGKSTILKAIKDMINIVMPNNYTNLGFDRTLPKMYNIPVEPFRLTDQIESETFFSLTFICFETEYRYTIKYNNKDSNITDEVLEDIGNNITIYSKKENKYFNLLKREEQILKQYNLNKNSILSMLKDETPIIDKVLLKHITNVYHFFNEISFDFISINKKDSISKLVLDKDALKTISKQISLFDLSVDSVEIDEKMDTDTNEITKDLIFIYNKYKLSFEEESKGTVDILNILFSLNTSNKKVWIIDDFGINLHEEVINELVKYLTDNYLDKQFIFVTNNLSFLNLKELKNKALHYLTERDEKYLSTKLVPLTNFKELRSDDRNSWERFYKTYRLAQYPKITINNIED